MPSALSLVIATLLALAVRADTEAPVVAKPAEYDAQIKLTDKITSNATDNSPYPGWQSADACYEEFCVWSNPAANDGRGLVVITTPANLETIKAGFAKTVVGSPDYHEPPAQDTSAFEIVTGKDGQPSVVSTKALKRGTEVITSSPMMIVHRHAIMDSHDAPSFQVRDDEEEEEPRPPEIYVPDAEKERLLSAALAQLNPATRQSLLVGLPAGATDKEATKHLHKLLRYTPWEVELAKPAGRIEPEPQPHRMLHAGPVAALSFSCRPNLAGRFSTPAEGLTLHLVVARKISGPGEPLTTVATTGTESLMLPRKDRHLVLAHRRGEWPPPTPQKQKDDKNKFKKSKKKERPPVPVGCTCERCTAHGDLAAMSASDERLEEIRKLENDLRSDNPQLASAASAARLVELYRLEGLETRIARAYELAALTLNYIGEDAAKVRKQAELARLGYIVEEGPDSNAAVAMRVMASDVRGHYSYKYLDVLREKAAQAAAARGR